MLLILSSYNYFHSQLIFIVYIYIIIIVEITNRVVIVKTIGLINTAL